ncbi:MAG: hypothetical protein KJO08_07680 [Gammaproteobacteria bacterium]|nr:hypothetical protein [Gammaproteobacteria bacterium]NNJ85336.1 hypothetical protein [Gammaproteobacteria bacterium]
MSNAIFGLIGVVLGAVLTVAKEWWFQRNSIRKERQFLCILVTCSLEKLGLKCDDVVFDGLRGEPLRNEYGHLIPQASTPDFDPQSLDVNWRSIPADLMYRIFNLVNEIDAAKNRIKDIVEYDLYPPVEEAYFEERQILYADIGKSCFALADQLRTLGGLPKRVFDEWDSVPERMDEQKKLAEKERARREARQRNCSLGSAPDPEAGTSE